MGLFPDPDSPHYHKAKVISREEVAGLIQKRIINYLPKPGAGSTVNGPTTDDTLRQLWAANHHSDYALAVYKPSGVYWIDDIKFSQSDEIGSYCLYGRTTDRTGPVPVAYLDNNGNVLPTSVCDNTHFVKEGRERVIHLQSRIIHLWLSNASFHFTNEDRSIVMLFSMQPKDEIKLTLPDEKAYASILTVTVLDTLSNREYKFRTQVGFMDYTQLTIEPIFESLIKPKFIEGLPEYCTVQSIVVTDFFGW